MSKNEADIFWIDVYEGEEYIGRLGTPDENGELQVGLDETIPVAMWYEFEDAKSFAEELTEKEDPYTYKVNGGCTSVAGNVLDYLTEEEFQEMIAGGNVPEEKLAALHYMMREHEDRMGRERSGENELPPDGHPLFTVNIINKEGEFGVHPHATMPTSMLFPTAIASLNLFNRLFEENIDQLRRLKKGEDLACEMLYVMHAMEDILFKMRYGEGVEFVATLNAKMTNDDFVAIHRYFPDEFLGKFWWHLLHTQYNEMGENKSMFSSLLYKAAKGMKEYEAETKEQH